MTADFILFVMVKPWLGSYLKTGIVIRILLIFKGVRALQILNQLLTLQILENLKEVTGTFALSGRSLGAILLMMFTILFIFSVLLRDLFQRSDPQRFGELFNTVFTLFQLFTLDDWSLIYLQSAQAGYGYIIIFLMVYILIQYFTFLNLVIAVLIDNFKVSLLKERQEKQQMEKQRLQEQSADKLPAGKGEAGAAPASEQAAFACQFARSVEGTEKEKRLLSSYLRLLAAIERAEQQLRARAAIGERVVDAFFQAPEQEPAQP
ncbi:cation channel sperm-associated protein 1-like isoform X2 [Struthio camelus]|uniref:cation channel sperm-associated protein 1-like isoform X2 n=1 Tax=Struthio camelus TaxID=8801 RepID=UPI003603D607